MQPYIVVVVRDAGVRAALADAMAGGNGDRVSSAPVTAVFAADLEPLRRLDALVDAERAAGKSPASLRALRFNASAVLAGGGGGRDGPTGAMCGVIGGAAHVARAAALSAASRLGVPLLPTLPSPEAWAGGAASMAAMVYMLAAASAGVGTHPMEGFDARAVADAVGLPRGRFAVPLVVATGYEESDAPAAPAETARGGAEPGRSATADGGGARRLQADGSGAAARASHSERPRPQPHHVRSPRFAPETVFQQDTYGRALPGVPVL